MFPDTYHGQMMAFRNALFTVVINLHIFNTGWLVSYFIQFTRICMVWVMYGVISFIEKNLVFPILQDK